MSTEILKMEGITKIYPNGIVANKNVDFTVNKGEIHALAGENGAGKSSLMKVLFGIESIEEGAIYLNGTKVEIKSPISAIKYGIGMVHQHFMLVPSLTVAENMVLGMEPKKRGLVDISKAISLTEEIAKKYNLMVDPKAIVADLPVGIKQKVEILKALARGAEILILDEPTAVLTPQETKELFKELKTFKENGHTIIFISHKLNEIKEICDRITIMRNGRSIGVYNVCDVTEEEISRMMVGRDVVLRTSKSKSNPENSILKVKNLGYVNKDGKSVLKNISFSVRSGEILGIAGVEGNGQRELVELITGQKKIIDGGVTINSKDIKNLSIYDIRQIGTSHIPEDRMTYGVAADGSIEENLISDKTRDKNLYRGLFFDREAINKLSEKLVRDYMIKCDTTKQPVKMLSGGNIQKVVVSRELSNEPKLIIADQPTRGIDIGAAEFVHRKLIELRDSGSAILLVSADLNEVIGLSDSLIVMYSGEITAFFRDSSEIKEEELGLYMLGIKKQSKEEIRGVEYE
jgi:simple sugar transport system ATP-binding protein